MENKDRWSALSLKDRADLMNMYITNGISDLKEMKKHYNSFAPGGPIETDEYGYPTDITPAVVEADYPRENEVWKRADASNADMVQRLRQGSSRATIQDWEDPRKVATHKMMSAGKYAVGNVQNINGQLFDFTDPKHGFKDPDKAAIDSAIKRGDYVEFDTEGDARYFAEHYKKHYNSFGDGGDKRTKIESDPSVENFIKDWYFNPTTLQIMTSIENDIYNQGIDIRSSDVEKKLNVRKALNTPEYITSLEDDKLGHHVYNSDGTSYIEYNDAYLWGSDNPSPFVRIHEIDHDIQKRMPAQTLLTTQPVEYKLNEGFKEDSYLDRPDEIRSRIMELRKFFKLNPSKRDYTPKEAAKFQEILQENELNVASGIERLSPETLAGFLNYLAYNDSNKNQEVKVAKYGGRILDGTETEQTLSGVSIDTSKPILNRKQYLQQQRDNVRMKALQNSLARIEPSNPVFENSQSQEEWEQDRLARMDYLVTRLYNAQTDEEAEMLNLGIHGVENETYSPTILGNNCIYTALDNYGKKYKVPGNLSFLANPGKYGFKEIKTSDIKPGDLVQKVLTGNNHHMMIFDSYDDNGLPLYNYSSSQSKTASDIKKKSHYYGENINDNNTYRAFTFIGNVEDNNIWNNNYNRYRKDYSSKVLEELKDVPKLPTDKVRILDGTEEEQTLSGKPMTRRVARSVYSYNSPEPTWDITKTPGVTEWYDAGYNTSNNTSSYVDDIIPEVTIEESKPMRGMKKLEKLNIITPQNNIETSLPQSDLIKPISHQSISREGFMNYVKTPIRNLRWKAQGFDGWSDKDLNYLYDRLGEAGWDPKAVMYGIDKETNFRTHVKNKNTSAIGLAQLTKEQMQTLFGENADKIYEEYANGTRSVKDVVDDTIKQYRWMYDRIKTERDNMGYGRLKINLLAPNASLDSIVSDVIYKHSLTDGQKRHLKKGKSTYRDLMKVYDKEFAKRFTKK